MKNSRIAIIMSFLFLVDFCAAQSEVLQISNFGGTPNSDITQAFIKAWTLACASPTPTKIVIPAGTYMLTGIDVKGPCKAPIEIQVDGTIQAPSDINLVQKGSDQWVRFQYINSLTLSGQGVFDGQGADVWKQGRAAWKKGSSASTKISMNLGFNFLNNTIVRDITSKDSKFFHIMVLACNNITFDGVTVTAPAMSPNTDGIHIGKSTDVKILNSNIGTGDDCVSLGDGSRKVTVQNVNCGPGHGISVGSLGKYMTEDHVAGLLVKNCTLKETDNGLRIKTWPSAPGTITITDMNFEDITMIDVLNPIIIDQEYCPYNQCSKENPSKIKISKVSFKNVHGTSKTPEGVIFICSSGVPCDEVELNNIDLTFNGAPTKAKCSNVRPIVIGKAPACQA